MHAMLFLKSRTLRSAAVAALGLYACSGSPTLSQGHANQASQNSKPLPAPLRDPTRPEIQPRLDVDRDPVPSPDIEETAPSTSTTGPSTGKPGEIQKRQDGVYTLHQDVDEVLQTCAVVDEKGRTVTDLKQADFHIWEDGIPQTTSSFLHQDQPVSLGIIVDNSGSMRDKRVAVNAAALNLLRNSNPRDASFIVNFSDHAFLDQGFTSDIDALNRGLSHYDSKGTTALYDAVIASADELTTHGKLPRQVLLVITDGADNASRLDLEQAIHRVQSLGGPVVYTIGLLFDADREESDKARSDLERLSQETGGIAYFPGNMRDIDEIAVEVARDIRDQYTLGYHSTRPASQGGFRTVRVEATAPKHGKLIVRTRRGYYANRKAAVKTQTADAAKP